MEQDTRSTERYNSTVRRATTHTGLFGKALGGLKFAVVWQMARKVGSMLGTVITESNEYQENMNLFTVAMGKYAESALEYGETVSEVLGKAIAFVKKTTENAVELFAQLCQYHNLDPLADGVIISHAEGYQRGIATNHGDPSHLWNGLGMDYNMDRFRADVAARMKGEEEMTQEQFNKMMDVYLTQQEAREPSDWSADARNWAEGEGIIAGDTNGNKMYKAFCTREQMVVFLRRLAQKLGA